jgi:hypothetical protein
MHVGHLCSLEPEPKGRVMTAQDGAEAESWVCGQQQGPESLGDDTTCEMVNSRQFLR